MKNTLIIVSILLTGCSDLYQELGIKPTHLKSSTTSVETQPGVFSQNEKDEYTYNNKGALVKHEHSIYNAQKDTFDLFSISEFNYGQGRLATITKKYIDNRASVVSTYTYTNGKLSKIHEDDQVDLDANITYLADGKVEVNYINSIGRSSIYRFTLTNGNATFEQTVDESGRVENEVVNEFDTKENPLLLLGYLDILFVNTSQNNKTKTTTTFFFDQKPTITPKSYVYKYNNFDYPTEVLTKFESTNTTSSSAVMKTVYVYN